MPRIEKIGLMVLDHARIRIESRRYELEERERNERVISRLIIIIIIIITRVGYRVTGQPQSGQVLRRGLMAGARPQHVSPPFPSLSSLPSLVGSFRRGSHTILAARIAASNKKRKGTRPTQERERERESFHICKLLFSSPTRSHTAASKRV